MSGTLLRTPLSLLLSTKSAHTLAWVASATSTLTPPPRHLTPAPWPSPWNPALVFAYLPAISRTPTSKTDEHVTAQQLSPPARAYGMMSGARKLVQVIVGNFAVASRGYSSMDGKREVL